jgi:glycerate kinase
MRVLAAPDKFKGTLTAAEAERAIAVGWHRARPQDEVVELPMADGGEGTLETLIAALDGTILHAEVAGPLGDPVEAGFGIADGPDGRVAVVEMALASGLGLLHSDRRDVKRATTRGTGELILAALGHEPVRLVVCIGGSATNDGGAGMARALGARFKDASGVDIAEGGSALLDLATIDARGLDPRLLSVRTSVACDVDNPLTGPSGASAVYGPQKGATEEDVQVLDRALGHYAAVLARDLGVDVRDVPGAGAAGGLGGGLVAFLGARLRPGVEVVMEAVGFAEQVTAADLVITGEGSFDAQSLHGKAVSGVVEMAHAGNVPAAVVCGRAEVHPEGLSVASLAERFGPERSLKQPRAALEELAAELAEDWTALP